MSKWPPKKKRKKMYVTCPEHGQEEMGYVVCKHVMDGYPVGHVDPPKPGYIGSIICVLKSASEHATEELHLMCSQCAGTAGYTVVHRGVMEVPG